MKKFLLLLVAVVLAGGLVLSCAQPSSYEITLKAGSAEGVAPDSIKVEAINGYNLITWKGTSDTKEDYTVYRKTVIDGEIDEETIKVVTTWTEITPIKAIAYTQDWNIEADARYVYGIVSRGFKEGSADAVAISDLVWQNEPEGGYVTAKKTAAGTRVAAAPAVTATAVRGDRSTTTTTDVVDIKDTIVITVKGLKPDYSYQFGIAWINRSSPNAVSAVTPTEAQRGGWAVDAVWVPPAGNDDGYYRSGAGQANADYDRGWAPINGGYNVFSIADYLDYGDTIELPEMTLQYSYGSGSTNVSGFYDYYSTSVSRHELDSWSGRLYVQYGTNYGTYPVTAYNGGSNDGTRFNSNQVELLKIEVK
jgi:hypothetical protein